MTIQTLRLKPTDIRAGEYDLDALALEYDPTADSFDFRLELGSGISIYWALPAAPRDRLRLLHVDGAAYHLDEPELVEDPFVCDLHLRWDGSLGTLADGSELRSVALTMTSSPASYRCEIKSYSSALGRDRDVTLSWPAAVATTWTAMTWNILMGGEDRFEEILDVVRAARPDVLTLQECLGWEGNDRLTRVAEAIGAEHAVLGIARPRASGSRYHVAVVSRFPIRSTTTHADPARVGHAIVEADIEAPGGLVKLLATHFDSHGEEQRLRDATSLLEIATAAAPATRVLVAGDLNALSRHDPYPAELDALLRAAGTTKYGDPARFETMELFEQHGLVDLLWRRGSPTSWVTASRDRGGVRIDFRTDYLLATEDLAQRAEKLEVLEVGPASDHAPVMVTFS